MPECLRRGRVVRIRWSGDEAAVENDQAAGRRWHPRSTRPPHRACQHHEQAGRCDEVASRSGEVRGGIADAARERMTFRRPPWRGWPPEPPFTSSTLPPSFTRKRSLNRVREVAGSNPTAPTG